MFATADPKQPFCVANQIVIFPQDQEVLIKLYQPLIGSTAVALYQTLIQDFDPLEILAEAKGIYCLQEQLNCSLRKMFSALHRLEAVGLIQTFLADNVVRKVLVFKMLKVPSSADFFATPLLASLLKEKIGDSNFHQVSHFFAKKNRLKQKTIKNARDVSASFFDVFRLPDQEAISPSAEIQQAERDNRLAKVGAAKINQQTRIDWPFMKQQFALYQINADEVDRHRQEIANLMRTYGLNEQDFVDECLPALHGKNKLEMPQIANLIARNFRSNHTRRQVNQEIAHDQKKKVGPHLAAAQNKLLRDATRLSPADFLYKIKEKKGGFVSSSEKRVLNNLSGQYGLPADLINILSYTCLSYDSMVSANLAYRIANDWLQHGVGTAAQALTYIAQRRRSKGPAHYRAQKRVEEGTDWSKKKAKEGNHQELADLQNFFKHLDNPNQAK